MSDDPTNKPEKIVHEVDLKRIRKEAHILPFEKLLGTNLFDRPHPKGYTEEWLQNLKKSIQETEEDGFSVLIFRLNNEWLALPTTAVHQVTEVSFIHQLPHMNSDVILGITNIEGELHIVISLKSLLGFQESEELKTTHLSHKVYPRMILFGTPKDNFVCIVDEVFATVQYTKYNEEDVPLTITKSLAHYTTGLFTFREHRIGLLDENLIIESLNENHL